MVRGERYAPDYAGLSKLPSVRVHVLKSLILSMRVMLRGQKDPVLVLRELLARAQNKVKANHVGAGPDEMRALGGI